MVTSGDVTARTAGWRSVGVRSIDFDDETTLGAVISRFGVDTQHAPVLDPLSIQSSSHSSNEASKPFTTPS